MIQHLYDLKFEELKQRYPNVPDFAMSGTVKYTDKTAAGLEKCICDFLNLSGHQAERIKNQGRMLDNTKIVTDTLGARRMIGSKQYIKGTGINGTADVSATIKGRAVKIEIKIGKNKQSEAQKKYQDDIIKAGGEYWIAKTFDDFYEKYVGFAGSEIV